MYGLGRSQLQILDQKQLSVTNLIDRWILGCLDVWKLEVVQASCQTPVVTADLRIDYETLQTVADNSRKQIHLISVSFPSLSLYSSVFSAFFFNLFVYLF